MFTNKFKVCVSLATDSADKLPKLIARALQKRADYVEIRFDHTIYKELDYALDISSRIKNRAIFTLRSKDEGGYFDGDHSEHISLLKKMAGASPMLLDIEISIIKKDKEMRQFLKENKIPILVSSHDFKRTPNLSSLLKKFEDMSNYSNYVKLVTTARTFEDNFKLLSLYDNNINTKLIAFAMGEHGILSRLLCILYGGSPFTYASLDNPLAPGQLDIVLMKKIYDRIGNNLKSK
ncbi:MAG: type I 3-dehydroquinate dehydratase [Nitrososphaeraceae archaeon]|nr:type I 3-dehydroquinate dehydratase [Nitrososphaeraceae archaeon]